MKSYLLHELTSKGFSDFLKNDPNGVVIFCLGSIEQHGRHLPLGTDFISVKDRALRIAQRSDSLVCYTTLAGYSPQHMNFSGTISLRQETLSNIIYDSMVSLAKHGVKRVLILNTHTTNGPIIESAILKVKESSPISIAYSRNYPSTFVRIFNNRKIKELDIHAGRSETAIMKALAPGLIDEDELTSIDRNVPERLASIINKENPDDIDRFLLDTILPAKSEDISSDGVYGVSDISKADKADYLNNIDHIIDFYVEFIRRWKKIKI